MSQNEKTIPNKTIAILIIIALLVTIISTWVILGAISNANQRQQLAQTHSVTSNNGDVILKISAPSTPISKTSTGQVLLNIKSNT